jgi:hypothetical protein
LREKIEEMEERDVVGGGEREIREGNENEEEEK